MKYSHKTIPDELLQKAISRLGVQLPFKCRGIKISKELIKATIEILNDAPDRMLPQHARNLIRAHTPDGLDLRIKNTMNSDTRTANIISDILASAGIVEVLTIKNKKTGRNIKATRLLSEWTY
ncbi:hypothetical protein A8F94_13815 [Bacillus sp. FJAT-27225]|uniref:hypothetical protein n=1 Tax=Bacillus sp. FJAT-27225 TaxID=1743144 RepID=UPI00080C2B6C|nr:hypothetical protein [Bacillus sp. FJAT-27225]OCA85921.1 hypothetical protein A8F94_13815 [Bacillus sp. FJAT-27225]